MDFILNNKIQFGIITLILLITILYFSGLFSKSKNNKETFINNTKKKTTETSCGCGSASRNSGKGDNVKELDNEGLNEHLDKMASDNIFRVYNFNTSWCKYSLLFATEWSKFETLVEDNESIKTYDVKCDEEENKEFCEQADVPGYPSIVIVINNKKINYPGQRNAISILKFIKELTQ